MSAGAPVCSAPAPVSGREPICDDRRLEKQKNDERFWREMFIEAGVRKEEKAKESVWKQRLTIMAVIFIVAAGVSQAVYRAYISYNFGFEYIDVQDTERLKEVMFGGSPWIVLCRWSGKPWKIPEILDKHRQELLQFGKLGSLNCGAILPSGMKFYERFKIPSSADAMLITNGKYPRVFNTWALKNWDNMSAFLQRSTRVEVAKVEENISFNKMCLFPPGGRCIIFFRKGGFAPEGRKFISTVLAEKGPTRKLKVVTVDSSRYEVTGVGITFSAFHVTRVACIGNVSPPPTPDAIKKKDTSKDTFIGAVYNGEFTNINALSYFAEKCISSVDGSEGFTRFDQVPILRRRLKAPESSSS